MHKGLGKYLTGIIDKPYLLESAGLKDDNGFDTAIRRDEIKNYLNNDFFEQYNIYLNTKFWGLPNGKGWANEPIDLIEMLTIFELETREIERERNGKL